VGDGFRSLSRLFGFAAAACYGFLILMTITPAVLVNAQRGPVGQGGSGWCPAVRPMGAANVTKPDARWRMAQFGRLA